MFDEQAENTETEQLKNMLRLIREDDQLPVRMSVAKHHPIEVARFIIEKMHETIVAELKQRGEYDEEEKVVH